MGQKRAYQYRFYPTDAQQQILARTFGCVHYVYNWARQLRIDTYAAEKRSLGTSELSRRLTMLKQQPQTAFLNAEMEGGWAVAKGAWRPQGIAMPGCRATMIIRFL